MSFASTDLPTLTGDVKKDEAAIRKSILDLLDKINTTTTIQPIPGKVSSDVTYIVNGLGVQTVLIKSTSLKASSGGPYKLTITSGSGSDVLVPIASSGDTILSGDLLFDIYIDSNGNVTSKNWEIDGLNTNGKYMYFSSGALIQNGSPSSSLTTSALGTVFRALYTINFPVTFSASQRYTIEISATSDTISPWAGGYDSFAQSSVRAFIYAGVAGTNTILIDWVAVGRWK